MGNDAWTRAPVRIKQRMSHASTDPPLFLRAAHVTDAPRLAAIELEAFSDPWPANAFVDVLQMPSVHAVVAVSADDVPKAYCILMIAADQGEIANLAVAPEGRRRGLASHLLRDALAFASGQGVISVYLEVRESNIAARALYESHQFRPIGRRRGYYQHPLEDALVLQWTGTT